LFAGAVMATANNATVASGASVTITASASDVDGTIASVAFYVDGVLRSTDNASPFSATWTSTLGSHQLTAVATDNHGLQTTSSVVVVKATGHYAAAADSYVRDGSSAGSNFGTATTVQTSTSASAGANRWTYVRFDLAGLGTLTGARLRLNGSMSSSGSNTITVLGLDAPTAAWTETAITWNNKPAATGAAVASVPVSGTAAKWYEWDVTAAVQAAKAAGRTSITLVLKSQNVATTSTSFNSRTANKNNPQLVIVP